MHTKLDTTIDELSSSNATAKQGDTPYARGGSWNVTFDDTPSVNNVTTCSLSAGIPAVLLKSHTTWIAVWTDGNAYPAMVRVVPPIDGPELAAID